MERGHGAIAGRFPASTTSITIGGVSLFDNNASLANAGVVYVILKDWGERGDGRGPAVGLHTRLQARSTRSRGARHVVPPPPIQGLGLAGGFQMQVAAHRRQLRLRASCRADGPDRGARQRAARAPRADDAVPRQRAAAHVDIDRRKAETLGVNVGDAFADDADLSRLDLCQPVPAFGAHSRSSCRPMRGSARRRRTSPAQGAATAGRAWCPSARWRGSKPSSGPQRAHALQPVPSATINGRRRPA